MIEERKNGRGQREKKGEGRKKKTRKKEEWKK
jgi:hypothetical protein